MKNRIKIISELWKYFKDDKKLIIIALVFAATCAVLLSLASMTIGLSLMAFDKIIEKGGGVSKINLYDSLFWAGITFVAYTLYWFSQSFVYRLMIWASHKAGSRIRVKVFKSMLSLSISYMDSKRTGEFISRTTNDVDQLIVNLTESLASSVTSPFVVVLSSTIMLLLSPYLAAIYFLMLPLVFIGAGLIASKASPHFVKQQEQLGELNAVGVEFIQNRDATYFFQKHKSISKKYSKISYEYMNSIRQGEYKIRLVWPWIDIIENCMYGIIFVVGAIFIGDPSDGVIDFWVFKGYSTVNFGLIATLLSFARISNGEIGQVSRLSSLFQKMLVCAKRTTDLINEKPEDDNGTFEPKNIEGNIEFKNVSFGYNSKNPIIKNFNLKIKKGTRVAIVGPTGCGKTTLSQLLLRFYDVDSGSIEIDGNDIRKFSKKYLSSLITIVLQDTHLFSVSIEENIRYGTQKNISKDEVINASKTMNSSHFVNLFPENYETILKNSSEISTGEAQLLALTRAYVNDSKILILDEATSSIDTKTEIEVQKGMLELMKGKTSFVIAHRLSTIINSDVIIVMDNGVIIEKGKHQELLDRKGFYYKLYNSKINE